MARFALEDTVNTIKDRMGLSLLEIIVAMLILSLVMYGLVSLMMVSKRFVYHSGSRVISMELGKYFFEDANLSVDAAHYTLNRNCLYDNASCVAVNRTLNQVMYNVTYRTGNVTDATNVNNTTLRKVVIDVNWVELR
jgi:Tfp pilus assembly protein PilV